MTLLPQGRPVCGAKVAILLSAEHDSVAWKVQSRLGLVGVSSRPFDLCQYQSGDLLNASQTNRRVARSFVVLH